MTQGLTLLNEITEPLTQFPASILGSHVPTITGTPTHYAINFKMTTSTYTLVYSQLGIKLWCFVYFGVEMKCNPHSY